MWWHISLYIKLFVLYFSVHFQIVREFYGDIDGVAVKWFMFGRRNKRVVNGEDWIKL